ncbi:MAG TPA: heparinase II/III family protein [Candidatus Aminicenantes bacterium]|nr:heparinase II/III family protein [Candidatus Aminicenantes bacterium]
MKTSRIFSMILAGLAAAFFAAGALTARTRDLLRPEHPRMLLTTAEIRKIKADPAALKTVQDAAEAMLRKTKTTSYKDCFAVFPATPFPDPHPYNPKWPYWTGVCREIADYLEVLAKGWAVTGDRRYHDAAFSTMAAVADWKQWTDPEYGYLPCLDTESLTMGMAYAYDLLHPDLKAAEKDKIQKAILEKGCEFIYGWGQKTGNYVHEPKLWPNGFAVINTAMGIGGLALLGDVPAAEKYVTESLAKMDKFYRTVAGPDGGLIEGFGYGSYAVDTFMRLIEMAHAVCGIDALKGDYLDNAVFFPLYCILPGGGKRSLPAIGDNGGPEGCDPTLIELNRVLVRLKKDSRAAWYLERAGRGDEESRSIARTPADLPLGRLFPSVNWVALREGWGEKEALMIFKSGHAHSHNHLDQNHFVLGWGGEWIIGDPGYQIYDMDYPPERKLDRKAIKNMHVYTARTEGHNSLLVDGKGQNVRSGKIPVFFSSTAFQCAVGDASASYEESLTRFLRYIFHVPGRYFLVYDDIAAASPVAVEFKLHTSPAGEFLASGKPIPLDGTSDCRNFLIRKPGAQVAVDLILPAKTTLAHKQWPDSRDYGHYVTIAGRKAAAAENAFILRAGPAGAPAAALHASVKAVKGGGRIFSIGGDRILVNPDGARIEEKAFSTDGKAAFVGVKEGKSRSALISGTYLNAGGKKTEKIAIQSTTPLCAGIEIDRSKMTVEAEARQGGQAVLACPFVPASITMDSKEVKVQEVYDKAAGVLRWNLPAGRHALIVNAGGQERRP